MKLKKNILLTAFALIMALQVFFITKRVHNYPFMIYDMYSRPEIKAGTAHQYLLIAGNDTLDLSNLPMLMEGRIINSLKVYEHQLLQGSDRWTPALESRMDRTVSDRLRARMDNKLRNHPDAAAAYPDWLQHFIEKRILHRSVHKFEVIKQTVNTTSGEIIQQTQLIGS